LSGPRLDARTWHRRGDLPGECEAVPKRSGGWRRRRHPIEGQPRRRGRLFGYERAGRPRTSGGPVPQGSSPGIHRFLRDRDSVAPVPPPVAPLNKGLRKVRSAREERPPKRLRRGGGEGPGEGSRALPPCRNRKVPGERWRSGGTPGASAGVRARPQGRERTGRKSAGSWVKQDVERVENPEDGRCRRGGSLRGIRAPTVRAL